MSVTSLSLCMLGNFTFAFLGGGRGLGGYLEIFSNLTFSKHNLSGMQSECSNSLDPDRA